MSPVSPRIVFTGCSCAGKSTLLEALAARGHATVPEPGRRIVRASLKAREGPLPWDDPAGFALACVAVARADFDAVATEPTPVIFDRSMVDALVALDRRGIPNPEPVPAYSRAVFLFPPWPELFKTDAERQHDFDAAVSEYNALHDGYRARGYDLIPVPRLPLDERVIWIEDRLEGRPT
ncbi:MAG: ATP-binding protein [Pseudomonadota bacterium]